MMDPITKEMTRQPVKPFMVNQLQLLVERGNLILSQYDKVLLKQLMDYEVEKLTESGVPKYTSENEHFVDALGLANLAMVLEFKNLIGIVKDVETTNKVEIVKKSFGTAKVDYDLAARENTFTDQRIKDFYKNTDFEERGSDRQHWVKVDSNYKSNKTFGGCGNSNKWGSRQITGNKRFGR